MLQSLSRRARATLPVAALLLTFMAGAAAADCYVNGEWVAEGSRLGNQVCQDGQWVGG